MIDVAAAERRRIAVRNVPHYCTEEVATHAVALALALWRNIPQFDADVRRGVWNASSAAMGIGRLSEATIALVGAGRIGSLVARAFAPWGSRIIVHDPAPAEDAYPRVSLDEVAKHADIISVHAPLNQHTHHMIDAEFFDRCERSPILINTSRGGLVDLEAVVDAIHAGALRGAGLDVFETEPLDPTHQILSNSKVLVTPHAAWCSRDALPELRTQAIMNVVNALKQEAE
jgi:D-3-phosphoglycerate dehydrogenase